MRYTSSLFSILALAFVSSLSVTAATPNTILVTREVTQSRPYAPELRTRTEEDPIQIKRSSSSILGESSWSISNLLSKRSSSEEELHSRGKLEDSIFEKRGWCWSDPDCGDGFYCSSPKHYCYKKLDYGKHCSRDFACDTGYCSPVSNKCRTKKAIGENCYGDDAACSTGYCSVVTNTCRAQASKGNKCLADSGCQSGLSCINQKCKKSGSHKPHHTHPHGPSPSGSPTDKRMLSNL